MDGKDIAIVIAALSTAGIPLLLIMFTVGGLLFGFTLWSVLNFLSQWMIPLIFLGAGVIALIELVPRGPREALIGVGALTVFVFLGYFVWSGAFNGPANTYSVFLSMAPSSPSSTADLGGSAVFVFALIVAALTAGYGIMKLIEED